MMQAERTCKNHERMFMRAFYLRNTGHMELLLKKFQNAYGIYLHIPFTAIVV